MTLSRPLTPQEWALFPDSFKAAIAPEKVRLINRSHNPFARGKVLVRGNRIYWPDCPDDFTATSLSRQALLMHELCHVWQYHTGRLSAFKYLMFPKNWVYKYDLDAIAQFDDLTIEKQADFMQDWYRLNRGCDPERFDPCGPLPTLEILNMIIPFEWDTPQLHAVLS